MPAGLVATQTQPTTPGRSRPWWGGLILLTLAVAATGGRASAQPDQLTPVEQAAIQRSIDRGVDHLKKAQNPTGSWGTGTDAGPGKGWAIAYTALAGLTLIECGVPNTDKQIQSAARVVRQGAERSDSPYELSLAILFLDRMGDPKDRPVIQRIATRLILGQTASGGWSYKVPPPLASGRNTDLVLDALRKMTPAGNALNFSLRDRPSSAGLCIKMSDDIRPKPAPTGAEADPEKAKAQALARLPQEVRKLPVFQDTEEVADADPKEKAQDPFNGTTDNSNTHFAILGLWAARRHDVPTERSFTLLVRRFRNSQLANGSWPYYYNVGGGSPAMTAVALLGLAIGHVLGIDPQGGGKLEQDPQVLSGLKALSRHVGEPAGEMEGRPAVEQSGGLYFFWAMERIAVLYDLRTLGNKDWYRWGAEILVSNQRRADGSWSDPGGYPGQTPIINTCFALLFLKRANLTPDLSRRLAIDSDALTEKPPVMDEPPPPEDEPTTVQLPDFRPSEAQPTPPTTTPQPAPPAETPAAPKAERLIWPWILGLLLLLIAAGVGIYFAMKSRKEEGADADEDERPRKKRGKAHR